MSGGVYWQCVERQCMELSVWRHIMQHEFCQKLLRFATHSSLNQVLTTVHSKIICCCLMCHDPQTQLGYCMWVNDLQFKQLTYKHTYCMADHVKVEHKYTIS